METYKPTTCPPIVDITKHFPEFRSLGRKAVLLHPRKQENVNVASSKLGGQILWSANDIIPFCDEHKQHFIPALQLLKKDAPLLSFWGNTDLFQLLWCPQQHKEYYYMPKCEIYWRNISSVADIFSEFPKPQLRDIDPLDVTQEYIPQECIFYPETIIEYPSIDELPDYLIEKLEKWDVSKIPNIKKITSTPVWKNPPYGAGGWLYITELSIAPGIKVGGYPDWVQYPEYPICNRGHRMEYFLSISPSEIDLINSESRWVPYEEKMLPHDEKYEIHYASKLFGNTGVMYFFICYECNEYPIKFVYQSD